MGSRPRDEWVSESTDVRKDIRASAKKRFDSQLSHRPLTANQLELLAPIREAVRVAAHLIIENVTICPDQVMALQRLREALIFAGVAIGQDET